MKSHRTEPSTLTREAGRKRRFDRTLVLGTFSVIAVSALPFGCGGKSEEETSAPAGRGGSDFNHADASERGGGAGRRPTGYGDGSPFAPGGSGGRIAGDGFSAADGYAIGGRYGDGYRGDGRQTSDGYALGGSGNRGGASTSDGNVHSDAGPIPSDGYDGGDGEGWSDGQPDGVYDYGDGEGSSGSGGGDDDPAFKAEPGDGPEL